MRALEQLRDRGHWLAFPSASNEASIAGAPRRLFRSAQDRDRNALSLCSADSPPGAVQGAEPWATEEAQAPRGGSCGRWWLGDARQELGRLPATLARSCDLVFLDAFSPGRCPQLWTQEFLGALARQIGRAHV